ncbi:MAG: MBL fold metallo-hydrolase [Oscillospiraceae bacterium]
MEKPNKITMITAGNENCYVLSNENTTILVDTCSKKARELVWERIKDLPIKLIILTHGHYDHIENAKYFADKFDAKIAMSQLDAELISSPLKNELKAKNFSGKVMLANYKRHVKKNKIDEFEIDIPLYDGFDLNEYGFDAKIISLSGHTKGSVAIISASKMAIVGDTLMNMPTPTTALIAEDFETCEKDVDRLRELSLESIYTGHGKKFNGRIWLTKENELATADSKRIDGDAKQD